MVGYSFEQIALVAKIETQLAIRSLPELIVQGARSQPMAVMIVRGDLAVGVEPPLTALPTGFGNVCGGVLVRQRCGSLR
jgi:pyruvate kinase